MIRNQYILLIVLLLCVSRLSAQFTLTVAMDDFANDKGVVSLVVLDENKVQVDGTSAKIKDKKSSVTFKNLKAGKYAVQFFHDENLNQKVDKNRIGIPKEAVGFSNDAIGKFGPKKFEKRLITVNRNTKIKIKARYML